MIRYTFIIVFLSTTYLGIAQQINGFVLDLNSSIPLQNVEIKNIRTQEIIKSDRNGGFKIDGEVNDYLAVNLFGYEPDTIFYYDEDIRRIYLNKDENILHIDEVLVKRLTDNSLSKELERAKNAGKIIELPKNKGGIKISPSRLLSRESKNARRNEDILYEEYQARKIDRRFTKHLIGSLLPLKDTEITLFRERFRPSVEFIETATDEDLKVYIIENYKVFKTK
ncbi:hypothetical protein [Sphingobacterium bovistauri]|uniref:CarboxypepD_reg-like domain-containing protein n=1 Tax=Sphingobacterium bovistauri TaxID=2781959 RepID=A0ABS7Z077_9SPHI|nr:hypothetical protein [Sphingobacterium bovistauri]MCA5003583.1 hypothetical protein [Sphingobacterium bovistauri]